MTARAEHFDIQRHAPEFGQACPGLREQHRDAQLERRAGDALPESGKLQRGQRRIGEQRQGRDGPPAGAARALPSPRGNTSASDGVPPRTPLRASASLDGALTARKPSPDRLLRKTPGKRRVVRGEHGELGLACRVVLEDVAQRERHHDDERRRHEEQHRQAVHVAREREPFLFPQGEQAAHQSRSERSVRRMKSCSRSRRP